MPSPDMPSFDFADDIRGDVGRRSRGLLIAAVVLLIVALACVGMAFAPDRPKVRLRVSWVPAAQSTERAFARLEQAGERP